MTATAIRTRLSLKILLTRYGNGEDKKCERQESKCSSLGLDVSQYHSYRFCSVHGYMVWEPVFCWNDVDWFGIFCFSFCAVLRKLVLVETLPSVCIIICPVSKVRGQLHTQHHWKQTLVTWHCDGKSINDLELPCGFKLQLVWLSKLHLHDQQPNSSCCLHYINERKQNM